MPEAEPGELIIDIADPAYAEIKLDEGKEKSGFPKSPTEASEATIGVKPEVSKDSLSCLADPKEKDEKKSDGPGSEIPRKLKRGPPPLAKNARSYTEAEYEEIFQAAIERIMNAPQDSQSQELDHVIAAKEKKPEKLMIKEKGKRRSESKRNEDEAGAVLEDKAHNIEPAEELEEQEEAQERLSEAQEVNENTPLCNDDEEIKKKIAKCPPKIHTKNPIKSRKKNSLAPKDLAFAKQGKAVEAQKNLVSKKRKRTPELDEDGGKKPVTKKPRTEGISKRRRMADREIEQEGIWVQCSLKSCKKWRTLKDVFDPSLIPDVWTCSMNTDPEQNTCDAPEAVFDPETEHEDFIYTQYAEGSLVWARMAGYPWWIGMVEVDPDFHVHFECRIKPNVASHYHVVFLDERVTRAWFSTKNLKPYTGVEDMGSTKIKGKDYKKQLALAKSHADEAYNMTLEGRVRRYGFAARYKGKWGEPLEEKLLKVKSPVPRIRGRLHKGQVKNSQTLPSVDYSEADGFCGLSTEEVDEILDNAESIIESANEALNELLSQNDDDEFVFHGSPKKVTRKFTGAKKAADKSKSKKKTDKALVKSKKQVDPATKTGPSVKKGKKPSFTTETALIKKGSPPSSCLPQQEKTKRKPMIPPKKNKAARPKESLHNNEAKLDVEPQVLKAVSQNRDDIKKESESTDVNDPDPLTSADVSEKRKTATKTTKESNKQPMRKKFIAPVISKPATEGVSDSKVKVDTKKDDGADSVVKVEAGKAEDEVKEEETKSEETEEVDESESLDNTGDKEGDAGDDRTEEVGDDVGDSREDLLLDLDVEVNEANPTVGESNDQETSRSQSMELDLEEPESLTANRDATGTIQTDMDFDFDFEE